MGNSQRAMARQRGHGPLVPAVGRTTRKANPAHNPDEIRVVLRWSDQPACPIVYPPSSRTIARLKAKADEAARAVVAAQILRGQVQPGLKPPAGKLFAADLDALVLRGPNGGLGSTERAIRTLVPLAAGGRHPAAVLLAAGGWSDEAALREALAALAPRLTVLGLRICRRKAGLRMAKLKPDRPQPEASC